MTSVYQDTHPFHPTREVPKSNIEALRSIQPQRKSCQSTSHYSLYSASSWAISPANDLAPSQSTNTQKSAPPFSAACQVQSHVSMYFRCIPNPSTREIEGNRATHSRPAIIGRKPLLAVREDSADGVIPAPKTAAKMPLNPSRQY